MSARDEAAKAEAARWMARMRAEDSARDRPAFEAWLAANPAHRTEYQKLERGVELSGGLADTPLYHGTPDLEDFAKPRLAGTLRMALAASIAMALIVSVVLTTRGGAPAAQAMVFAETSSLGEIRAVKLPDGTAVTLDTDSKIEARFDTTSRRVRLVQGRARFDVRPDPARTFIVEAAGRDISVDGARFDVTNTFNTVRVQSLQGDVSVRPSVATARFASYTVPAGEALSFTDRGDTDRPGAATPGAERWVDGMLVYEGTPLGVVLAETNRYAKQHIILADPALSLQKVTGGFRPLPVEELAKTLAAAFNLRVDKNAAGDLILSAD